MVDQGLVIAEIFILVALIIFVGTSTYLFHSKKNDFPIKARAPFRGTYAIVYAISLNTIADVVLQLTGQQIQCVPPQILKTIGGNLFVLGFGAKILDLCVAYEAEEWKKKMHLDSFDEKTKLPMTIRIRKALKGRKMHLFLLGFVGMWLLFWVLALGSVSNATSPDLLWTSPDCLKVQTISGLDVVFNLILVAVGFLIVAKNLRKVQDNHFQRDELKYLTIALLVVLIQWLIGSAVDARIIYSPVGAIFQSQMPAFYVTAISMFHIWWRARSFANRTDATHTSKKSEDLDTISNHTGTAPEAALSPRSNNNKNQIENILNNAEDFEDFEKFLQREFATEELYFLQEVFVFEREAHNYSSEEAHAKAKKIFNKYIVETSHLCVNISGTVRRELTENMSSDKAPADVSKVFTRAYMEVIHLLATDKFRRYKHQSKYYTLRSAKAELQESMPMTAVSVPTTPSANSG
jgi:hypothetical protein